MDVTCSLFFSFRHLVCHSRGLLSFMLPSLTLFTLIFLVLWQYVLSFAVCHVNFVSACKNWLWFSPWLKLTRLLEFCVWAERKPKMTVARLLMRFVDQRGFFIIRFMRFESLDWFGARVLRSRLISIWRMFWSRVKLLNTVNFFFKVRSWK